MANYFNQLKNIIVDNVSHNENIKSLVNEFNKINKDLQTKGNAWNKYLHSEKEKKVKQAHTKYKTILKTISSTQKTFDKEVHKAIVHLKKSAVQVEKNLMGYKKKAITQKKQLEKILAKKSKPTAAKAGAKRKRSPARKAARA